MRSVRVGLEADVKGFNEPIDRAASKVDDLKGKTDALDRSVNKLPADTAKAGAGIKDVGDKADTSARKVDQLGDQVDQLDRSLSKIPADSAKAAAAMKLLDGDIADVQRNIETIGDKSTALTVLERRIGTARAEVKRLTEEFEKSGDLNVFRRLGQSQGNLSALTAIRRQLADSIKGGAEDGAKTFAQLFQGGIIEALSNPAVATVVASVAIPLIATLGSAIGGAITAAGAIGAVGIGVAGAAQASPERVGAAWSGEISRIKAEWLDASRVFVAPTEMAIQRLGAAVHSVDLAGILQKASTFVEPLSQGIAGLAEHLGNAFKILVDGAGPVIETLRDKLPEIGAAVEMFAKDVTGGAQSGADALGELIDWLSLGIGMVGKFIAAAELMYHWFDQMRSGIAGLIDHLRETNGLLYVTLALADKASGLFEPSAKSIEGYGRQIKTSAEATRDLAMSASEANPTLEELNSQLKKVEVTADSLAAAVVKKLFDSMMSLDQASLGVYESLTKVEAAFKKNGDTIRITTKEGQANREAVLSAVSANMSLYQAQVSVGMSSVDAAAAYDQNTAALEKQLRQAGLTKGEISELIGKYRGVPAKVNTEIATIGLKNAIDDLRETIALANGLDGKKIVFNSYLHEHYTKTYDDMGLGGQGNWQRKAQGGIRRAAAGLVVPPSDPGTVLFGEPQTGGEALIPLRGISQMRAMSLAQTVGDSYGFNVAPQGGGGPSVTVIVQPVVSGGTSGLATLLHGMQRRGELQFAVKTR